ncbi:MAG TPA: helix-turn-helix domain-containing protein [Steroidobacteraceae bacterium]|nr:helix-turn-helix domain-containing protein [Steroidobacteraceae bacterium]
MHTLGLLLLPELSHLGQAAVTEPLFVANWLAQRPLFEWRSVSLDGQPVRASNGARLPVDGDLSAARGCGSVFVLASFEPLQTAQSKPLVRWLQRLARSGVELGGIENGSLALAAAGLLDEHPAAVHWDNLAGFQELFPRVRISPRAYSFTHNRVTCAGAASILDMMIAWIARHADAQVAEEVARHLLLGGANRPVGGGRRGTDSPAGTASPVVEGARHDDTVARARALMQAHIDDPLPCDVLAQRLNLSLRQLERRFKQAAGRTVHAEYRLVRVERAHQYLQQTTLSVTEVAALTGFSSVEYFSKVYRRAFATLPSTDRRQSTDAPVFRRHSR